MKRVITYGTFDVLHYGHVNLLKRAKALGDYLIVALSSEKAVISPTPTTLKTKPNFTISATFMPP